MKVAIFISVVCLKCLFAGSCAEISSSHSSGIVFARCCFGENSKMSKTKKTKEAYWYRTIFHDLFPQPAAGLSSSNIMFCFSLVVSKEKTVMAWTPRYFFECDFFFLEKKKLIFAFLKAGARPRIPVEECKRSTSKRSSNKKKIHRGGFI
jgi:hypothetical protein